MSREPALTYEGALRILGRRERKWLERLDVVLGGVILAAGAATLITPLAAFTAFAAMWGWTEQKDEALKLVRKGLDASAKDLRSTAGLERRELILAAHTTLVIASYFEVFRETLGEQTWELLDLSQEERRKLAIPAATYLFQSEVPAPSAMLGFFENREHIIEWMFGIERRVWHFISGLEMSESGKIRISSVAERAVERYETQFIRLAASIPELRVWVEISEHAATRWNFGELGDELLPILNGQTQALARLESILLSATIPQASPPEVGHQRASIGSVNRAALDEKIIPESAAEHYGRHLIFPTVRQMFVNPRYRLGRAAPESKLTDETWWQKQQVRDDLDLRLVAHLTSLEAMSLPLLILGHPGAGKSMLTRVLAARLPEDSYTVVRVPLRHVAAHTPVYDQIQQALDRVTHHRVVWPELVEQSLGTIRVVILDGLDELLHQAHTRLYGYLRAVKEFQRDELAQNRPVVVIVTSRTVVTDRVDIPDGTAVIKLEEFDDGQIGKWLDAWGDVNSAGIEAGTARPLPIELALEQRSLTCQPLLLMMMAIYVADPDVPVIEAQISSADLYGRLLTHFAEREAAKSPTPLSPEELRDSIEDHLRRLSIAALGIFNRGRQDITAEELGSDLAALEKQGGAAVDAGHRLLGEFFFVYTSEARFLSVEAPDRQYEFLHATFGEYLVARRIIEELAEVTHASFSARRGVREPEDDLLFALLSFEVLSARRQILSFAVELCAGLSQAERGHMVEVLNLLIAVHRDRHGSAKYLDYRPKAADRVRELAAYTANLVLLRVAVNAGKWLPLEGIFPGVDNPYLPWRSMLSLWRAGLEGESWRAIISSLEHRTSRLQLVLGHNSAGSDAQLLSGLAGDRIASDIVRYGEAFVDVTLYAKPGDSARTIHGPWLALALANWQPGGISSFNISKQEFEDPVWVDDYVDKLEMLLKIRAHDTASAQMEDFVRFILDYRRIRAADPVALAAAVLVHPQLLGRIPELNDPDLFSAPAAALIFQMISQDYSVVTPELEMLARKVAQRSRLGELNENVLDAVRDLLQAHRWPMTARFL